MGHIDRMKEEIRGADVLVLLFYYREGVPRALLEGQSLQQIVSGAGKR
jgi:hypothetical protein